MATSPSLSSSEKVGIPGGRENIKLPNQEVQDLGKFAVDEYNKKHGTHLSFSQVIKAEKQVVAGFRYYLLLEAINDELSCKYNAVVVVNASPPTKELVSFELATN